MHGQSPTSIELAGATGYIGEPPSLQQKRAAGRNLETVSLTPSSDVCLARFVGLLGGKGHGPDLTVALCFDNRQIDEREPHGILAGARAKGAEVSLPSSVKKFGSTEDRLFRLAVGKPLLADGVSPQARPLGVENA